RSYGDWSSDVCSSILGVGGRDKQACHGTQRPLRPRSKPCTRPKKIFAAFALWTGLAAGGDPKVGRPGKCGRQFGRLADGSKERRSEERRVGKARRDRW